MGTTRASNDTLKRIVNTIMDEQEGYEYMLEEAPKRLFNFAWDELENRYFPNNEIHISWGQMKALVECNVVISDSDFQKIAETYGENTKAMVKLWKDKCLHTIQHPSREETQKLLEENNSSIQERLF